MSKVIIKADEVEDFAVLKKNDPNQKSNPNYSPQISKFNFKKISTGQGEINNFVGFKEIEDNNRLGKIAKLKEALAKKSKDLEIENNKTLAEIESKAECFLEEAEKKGSEIEEKAYRKGYKLGREKGYKDGRDEVVRLIKRLDKIVTTAIDIKDDLIRSSEKTMIDLILTISRKVIKDEIKERQDIVLQNVREALKKVKDEEQIFIRVNLADLKITSKHKDEFLKMFDSYKKINIIEDSRVDEGGCLLEAGPSFIDARISTQLDAIEESIKSTSLL